MPLDFILNIKNDRNEKTPFTITVYYTSIFWARNFIIMWENIKGTLKEIWGYIKWAAGIGFCADILTGEFPNGTLVFPVLFVFGIISWSIVLFVFAPTAVKFIELIPDWLVNLTPKWLKHLFGSTTFWVWMWWICGFFGTLGYLALVL